VSQWSGGFTAEVSLHNLSDRPLDGWTLGWTFPSGQRISHAWGAETVTAGGPSALLRNLPWNARVAPGGSVGLGFVGTYQGSNAVPVDYAVNGVSCGGPA
jgi:hypothetical protein